LRTKFVWLGFASIGIIIGFRAYRQNQFAYRSETQSSIVDPSSKQGAGQQKLTHQTKSLTNGSFVVGTSEPHAIRFTVNANEMHNITIDGEFSVYSPLDNGVEVFLFDEENYKNWSRRNQSHPMFQSGKAATGEIKTPISEPGVYYLVFNNEASLLDPKTVNANVQLDYEN